MRLIFAAVVVVVVVVVIHMMMTICKARICPYSNSMLTALGKKEKKNRKRKETDRVNKVTGAQ